MIPRVAPLGGALVLLAGLSPGQNLPCCSSGKSESGCHHAAIERLLPITEGASEKEQRLREIHERALLSEHPLLGTAGIDRYRRELAESEATGNPNAILGPMLALAHFLMCEGSIGEAIRYLEESLELIDRSPAQSEAGKTAILYRLGMTYMRLAERENCIAYHNEESCIFPLSKAAVHVDKTGARRAKEIFELVLERDEAYVEARWLLNVAHMALGTYPDDVPEEHLFSPERFESEADVDRFADVAPRLGLHRFTRAGSALLEDFDGDGRVDVLSSSFDTSKSLRLFRQNEKGTFDDVTRQSGIAEQLGGCHLVRGDVNGDGRLDVLVLRGGGLGSNGEMPCSLLVQDSSGFRDVTAAAGIEVEAPTRTAAFADMDLDGDLDLFIGYESEVVTEQGSEGSELRYPSRLYRNDGKGVFEEVTAEAGIVNPAACVGAVFGDYDGDRYPDLYLSNRGGANRLFRNLGDGTFRDVAEKLGVTAPLESLATWFFDHDNDGDLDLFVASHGRYLRERRQAQYFFDGQIEGETSKLYENDGEGGFEDVSRAQGLDFLVHALGASFGDIDNDGYLDVYLGTGELEMSALWPNVMLRNDRGLTFHDVTRSGGFGHLQKSACVSFGDYDADGDQDVFVQVGGFYQDDAFGDVLFENPASRNRRWIAIDLEGRRSNRFGIGARIRVRIRESDERGVRDIYATVGANSSSGGNTLREEIGLGQAEEIIELEVLWPADGALQVFRSVPLETVIRIREGDPRLH